MFLTKQIFGSAGGIDQRALAQFREHLGGESFPGANHSAADHEHIQVENVNQVGQQNSQRLAEALKNALSVGVSLSGQVVDRSGAEFRIGTGRLGERRRRSGFDRLAGHAHDRGG